MIGKKLDNENEDLLFMILELYTTVLSRFGIKVITKNGFVLVLYLFRDIISFKLEKGDDIKLSYTSFLYKQKR